METHLRRFCRAGISLVCLSFVGCLQIPYWIPEVSYVPPVHAKCTSAEVYAFRVDITQKMEITELRKSVRGEVVDHEELTHLKTSDHGTTSSQVGVTLASGWRYVGLWNHDTERTGHAVALRFYRPGFETIVLKPGEAPRDLERRKAPDLLDQIKALDDLMSFSNPGEVRGKAVLKHVLEPGAKSAGHREALLFAANEYERLAKGTSSWDSGDKELRADLQERTKNLRALAKGE